MAPRKKRVVINPPNRIPTKLQRRAASNLIEYLDPKSERFNTLTELLIDAGFSELTAGANPKAIITSRGVQQALSDLGFKEDSAKAIVAEILLSGAEANRLKAAEMIFKVFGTFAPEQKDVTLKGFFINLYKEIENGQKPIIEESNN